MIIMSEYTFKARLAPTALAAPPILLLCNVLFDTQASQWLESDTMTWLFGKGVASAALVYFMMQVNRFIGLEIFQRWVSKDELNFPTTRLLLATNIEMSSAQRDNIDKKIQKDFQIALLSQVMGDNHQVRRHNADIVGRIRKFVGNPKKLLRFNIEYGFFRNLIGASVPALLAGIVCGYIYWDGLFPKWAFHITLAYDFFALILIFTSRFIIERLGIQYARVLFQEYLEKDNKNSVG